LTSSGTTPRGRRLDLLALLPLLRRLSRSRWFPLALVLPVLALLLVVLVAGLLGTPVGNHNASIVLVWILWWFLLIAVLVPFASRAWCAACPIPFFGEWLQRRSLLAVRHEKGRPDPQRPGHRIGRNRYFGLARRWPRALSNLWVQNAGFLLLCTFSVPLLTQPLVSAVAVGILLVAATAVALLYRQRTFCKYLCPVGGFLGLYSMAATVEVRARDAGVCGSCRDKGCLAGNERGWGCPWLEYPSRLARNNSCGLCLECVKTCPHENMSLFLRPPFADRRLAGWDEAWKAFLMLALALAYSAVYLGPWGELKDWANVTETRDWAGFAAYAGGLWALALVVLPALFLAAVWLGRRLAGGGAGHKEVALATAYSLVPLGLLAWIAFSVPLVLANGSYILAVASDPAGWGWDLFGSAGIAWSPLAPHWTPYLQVALVLGGLHAGLRTGLAQARGVFGNDRAALLGFTPVALLLTLLTLALLRLYAG
jgi:polyferredoxin